MKKIIAGAALSVLALAGCTNSANEKAEALTNNQQERYQANQPIPQFDWSQYRETVISIQNAQVHGQATTTFFFNQGVENPIMTCPSIGYAVPATTQLTNPEARVYSGTTLPQAEPSGVFTGDTSGTYAVCVDDNGQAYPVYWEGFIQTVGGPATWSNGTVTLDGAPSVPVNQSPEG